mmetsp:Transcript_31391/g.65035  ORF Transcript_31391/g.65035 Transcript_31391/m.65035 type:complete len:255 (+) Transcript_31391:1518-2282(+)
MSTSTSCVRTIGSFMLSWMSFIFWCSVPSSRRGRRGRYLLGCLRSSFSQLLKSVPSGDGPEGASASPGPQGNGATSAFFGRSHGWKFRCALDGTGVASVSAPASDACSCSGCSLGGAATFGAGGADDFLKKLLMKEACLTTFSSFGFSGALAFFSSVFFTSFSFSFSSFLTRSSSSFFFCRSSFSSCLFLSASIFSFSFSNFASSFFFSCSILASSFSLCFRSCSSNLTNLSFMTSNALSNLPNSLAQFSSIIF